jgi:hypothetical protein
MADFTMCKPQRCKLKLSCLRFTSKATEGQVYFNDEPCNHEGTDCKVYFKKNCKPCGEI